MLFFYVVRDGIEIFLTAVCYQVDDGVFYPEAGE